MTCKDLSLDEGNKATTGDGDVGNGGSSVFATLPHVLLLNGFFGNSDPTQIAQNASITVT